VGSAAAGWSSDVGNHHELFPNADGATAPSGESTPRDGSALHGTAYEPLFYPCSKSGDWNNPSQLERSLRMDPSAWIASKSQRSSEARMPQFRLRFALSRGRFAAPRHVARIDSATLLPESGDGSEHSLEMTAESLPLTDAPTRAKTRPRANIVLAMPGSKSLRPGALQGRSIFRNSYSQSINSLGNGTVRKKLPR
jgi:hypothetical protein